MYTTRGSSKCLRKFDQKILKSFAVLDNEKYRGGRAFMNMEVC